MAAPLVWPDFYDPIMTASTGFHFCPCIKIRQKFHIGHMSERLLVASIVWLKKLGQGRTPVIPHTSGMSDYNTSLFIAVIISYFLCFILTDFGFATRYPTNKCKLLSTFCGSYAYAAPEILQAHKYDGKCADMWSM